MHFDLVSSNTPRFYFSFTHFPHNFYLFQTKIEADRGREESRFQDESYHWNILFTCGRTHWVSIFRRHCQKICVLKRRRNYSFRSWQDIYKIWASNYYYFYRFTKLETSKFYISYIMQVLKQPCSFVQGILVHWHTYFHGFKKVQKYHGCSFKLIMYYVCVCD